MLTIKTKSFLQAIDKVRPFLPRKFNDFYDKFYVTYAAGVLRIGYVCVGTEKVSFGGWVPVEHIGTVEPFCVQLERRFLLDSLLKKFPDKLTLGFERDKFNNWLVLGLVNGSYRLAAKDAPSLPVIDQSAAQSFTYPRLKLIADLSQLKPFYLPTEQTVNHPTLSFIHWKTNESGQIIYQATDNRSAIIHNSEVEPGFSLDLCLNGNFSAEILTLVKRLKFDYLTVTVSDDFITFESPDGVTVGGTLPKIPDGYYPDLSNLILTKCGDREAEVIVSAKRLTEALKIAQKFQNDDEKVGGVVLEVGKGRIEITPANLSGFKIDMPAETSGSGQRYNLHAAKRILNMIPPGEAEVFFDILPSTEATAPPLLRSRTKTTTRILSVTKL